MSSSHRNRLAGETSPYLQQHADNPVDWYPWSEEALALARRENKPILLSIGYSACHWCHVMAHESFEDPATARVMNELFVNIKVDREERPDIDRIYQIAYQLLNRRAGGWPLTMFLTPDDQVPFFAATYVPREARYGMPAFVDLIQRLMGFYRERESEIRQQNDSLMEVLGRIAAGPETEGPAKLDDRPWEASRNLLISSLDRQYGGFGQAPKFPHPSGLEQLLHQSYRPRDDEARMALSLTLDCMAGGGIYDQIGGGFCRYSTDEQWMIPHFEKMLYDNGPLLGLYCETWKLTGSESYRRVAVETAEWVMREMQSPEGGYYSSLDADSEGEEGKFYVWTPGEVENFLDPKEYAVLAPHLGLDRPANFEGHWHFHVFKDLERVAIDLGITPDLARQRLDAARRKLLAVRERRVWPGRDEKILGSWNGLMIRGMAVAGRLLDEPRYLDSATRAMDFIRQTLWQNGRLLATYKDGKAHLSAYLDDHANLMEAALALLAARWRPEDLRFAVELAEVLLKHFEDRDQGGFYFTADDHEALIQRPKPVADDALPAGNGVAARCLLRLGHLLGETRYLATAERVLRWASATLRQHPGGCHAMLMALDDYLHPEETVILRGEAGALDRWRALCDRHHDPRRQLLPIPAAATDLPPALAVRTAKGPITAYVCQGSECSLPITEEAYLETRLRQATL